MTLRRPGVGWTGTRQRRRDQGDLLFIGLGMAPFRRHPISSDPQAEPAIVNPDRIVVDILEAAQCAPNGLHSCVVATSCEKQLRFYRDERHAMYGSSRSTSSAVFSAPRAHEKRPVRSWASARGTIVAELARYRGKRKKLGKKRLGFVIAPAEYKYRGRVVRQATTEAQVEPFAPDQPYTVKSCTPGLLVKPGLLVDIFRFEYVRQMVS